MASYQYVFSMYKMTKVIPPSREVLKDITLAFLPGAKIGVLGVNGSGKSTLLKIMAGVDKAYNGEAKLADGATVGYLSQEPELDPTKDVRGNVEAGLGRIKDLLTRFEELSMNYSEETAEEFEKLQHEIDALDGWNLDTTVDIAMDALRVADGATDVSTLSGGEKRRVALCRLLLSAPDLLLLDEPTNHLDAESVAWLEQHLDRYPGTVVAVTHDRYFLDNVAGWILELHAGKGIPFEGNYSGWLEQKRARLATEEKQASQRQQTLARELDWVRMSTRGRQAKSKARVQNYENLLAETQSDRVDALEIYIPPGPRLGNVVVQGHGMTKAYGDKLLFENFDFELPPGGIVGVIGPNGAGKTTLMRMIVGQEQPDAGTLKIGETVQLAYVDQSRDSLDPEKTVWAEISGGDEQMKLGKRVMQSRAYVSGFNFKGGDQQKKVGILSGGERNRVHMAKLLRSGGNVLILDEPTNDLDVDTLRALEEALLEFGGCAVVVSHDRWFLDRIATHIIAFEGDSQVVFFNGNYTEYEIDHKKRVGNDTPHRIKYKPLVRV
ncbi:MAG: energy-dependent translational throttle protein EttA [Candidatus Sericytochromatia bacterium]|nr:energy-dependent translational throttle protein EttA [Candidatus Sericytochromatia bacterium]